MTQKRNSLPVFGYMTQSGASQNKQPPGAIGMISYSSSAFNFAFQSNRSNMNEFLSMGCYPMFKEVKVTRSVIEVNNNMYIPNK